MKVGITQRMRNKTFSDFVDMVITIGVLSLVGFVAVLIILAGIIHFSGDACAVNMEDSPSITNEKKMDKIFKKQHEERVLSAQEQVEAEYIAKTVYGEARGCPPVEQAAVVWCILNRVDSDDPYYPDDIIGVVTQENQFHGFDYGHPVVDDLYTLTIDVLTDWKDEKAGVECVNRVLPPDYLFFHGDGAHNYFRQNYISDGSYYDFGGAE